VTPVTATGTTGAALRADLKTLMATFLAANMQIAGAVFIMTQQTALSISLMTNSLGNKEFPNISMNGGTLLGLPVVTSENVPATGGSPTDGYRSSSSAPGHPSADDGNHHRREPRGLAADGYGARLPGNCLHDHGLHVPAEHDRDPGRALHQLGQAPHWRRSYIQNARYFE
jgi:hypothetical protein